jgi:RNA polymerase sigma-70 factor (ECF subfamily)
LPRDPVHATEQLYKQHGGTVLRYAWHLLSRREDAEDATQATFLAVHRALAGGTAVLEPGAWVLRIARNECMGRLRQARPVTGLLEGDFDPPAVGGVELVAELRDEMRTAQQTLSRLPVPEREAFVLREWLGLETGEVAVTLGVTPSEVDALAGRARRSLVLAVGGLEPAAGCEGTQAALEAGSVLDRAGKVHLLRCPICRGVRRALRPPEPAERSLAPVAARLATVLPGFASGGGGLAAALAAKASAAPLLAKTAALVAAALVTGGAVEEGIRSTQPAHHRIAAAVAVAAPARGAQALASAASAPAAKSTGGAAAATFVALRRAMPAHATRGGAAGLTGKGAARTSHDGHGGAAQRHGSNDGGGTSADTHETSGKDGSGSHGDHASGDQATSSGDGTAAGRSTDSGSGDSGATHDSHGKGDSGTGGSGDGSDGSDNTPTATTLGGSAIASSGHGGSDEGPPPAANDPAATVPTDASAD